MAHFEVISSSLAIDIKALFFLQLALNIKAGSTLALRGRFSRCQAIFKPLPAGRAVTYSQFVARQSLVKATLVCHIPIGSMYAIYGNIYHQYTPNVSIYIYHTWILWDMCHFNRTFTMGFSGPRRPPQTHFQGTGALAQPLRSSVPILAGFPFNKWSRSSRFFFLEIEWNWWTSGKQTVSDCDVPLPCTLTARYWTSLFRPTLITGSLPTVKWRQGPGPFSPGLIGLQLHKSARMVQGVKRFSWKSCPFQGAEN